ncbi:MAG: hypothetical protein HY287_13945 [Planctomycetes bacterium]|nr:hypothetical protein [Planctomycetota bacterium]MBI3835424.1 hypothetical protein [Planctomycetota bacterium]
MGSGILESSEIEAEKSAGTLFRSSVGMDCGFGLDNSAIRSRQQVREKDLVVNIGSEIDYISSGPFYETWMDIENAWDEEEEAEAADDDDDEEEEEEDDDFYGDDDEEFDEFDDDDDDDDDDEDEEE